MANTDIRIGDHIYAKCMLGGECFAKFRGIVIGHEIENDVIIHKILSVYPEVFVESYVQGKDDIIEIHSVEGFKLTDKLL